MQRIRAAYDMSDRGKTASRKSMTQLTRDPAQVDFKDRVAGTKTDEELNREASNMLRNRLTTSAFRK